MTRPHYVGTSALRVSLGLTWHKFLDYWKKDVIPLADATTGHDQRPLWLMSNVESIHAKIAEYESLQVAARNNAIL